MKHHYYHNAHQPDRRLPPKESGAWPLIASHDCVTFNIALVPQFDIHNLSALTDTFSIANRCGSNVEFKLRLIGFEAGENSSCGIKIRPMADLRSAEPQSNIVLVGNGTSLIERNGAICGWLRAHARLGSRFVGLGNGVTLLAEAGLTRRKKVSANWRSRQLWGEVYEGTRFVTDIFVGDQWLMTTPGGRPAVHMAIHLVESVAGHNVALRVAAALNLPRIRHGWEVQTIDAHAVADDPDCLLHRAISVISENVGNRLSSERLCRALNIAPRQLQRLFKSKLKTTPERYYLNCRLDYARALIHQTSMSITEAAVTSGFESSSHFSTRFRMRFGVSPREDRREHATDSLPSEGGIVSAISRRESESARPRVCEPAGFS